MTSSGLVIVGAIEMVVPLITVLALGTLPVSATVLDPVASVPAADDVLSVFCTSTLAALIRRA
jgi:hypothetical protein